MGAVREVSFYAVPLLLCFSVVTFNTHTHKMQKTLVILMANFILPPAGVCIHSPFMAAVYIVLNKENYILSINKVVCVLFETL